MTTRCTALRRLLTCGLVCLVSVPSHAQSFPAAATYAAYYDQLMSVKPLADQSAAVAGITLKRDVGELAFQEGRIWLLTPVNGRTVGIAFRAGATSDSARRAPWSRSG